MSHQIRVAPPGEERPIRPANRYPVEPYVSERHRLDGYRSDASLILRGTEQSGLERESPIAVSARSFRKQNQRIPGGQSSRYRVTLSYRAAHSSIYENRALQFG